LVSSLYIELTIRRSKFCNNCRLLSRKCRVFCIRYVHSSCVVDNATSAERTSSADRGFCHDGVRNYALRPIVPKTRLFSRQRKRNLVDQLNDQVLDDQSLKSILIWTQLFPTDIILIVSIEFNFKIVLCTSLKNTIQLQHTKGTRIYYFA